MSKADVSSSVGCMLVVALFIALAVALYWRQQYIVAESFMPSSFSYVSDKSSSAIGPYDGIVLPMTSTVHELATATRQNATVFGHHVPLRHSDSYKVLAHSKTYPTVDGTPNTPRDMFMFAHNQSHPECCPSTYSTSTGCICTTPEQRRWLFMRGKT
jgi:hypothetical protein